MAATRLAACPRIREFKEFIETRYSLPVVVGTHPIPLNYFQVHDKLPFWKDMNMEELAGDLMKEDRRIMESYN
ncbi:MAG: hypothetical protein H6P98_708 [Candidatus Aminicenantes bacterium]|nr:hypothetical protein [Candidatus Aminicenantes bacterium]